MLRLTDIVPPILFFRQRASLRKLAEESAARCFEDLDHFIGPLLVGNIEPLDEEIETFSQ